MEAVIVLILLVVLVLLITLKSTVTDRLNAMSRELHELRNFLKDNAVKVGTATARLREEAREDKPETLAPTPQERWSPPAAIPLPDSIAAAAIPAPEPAEIPMAATPKPEAPPVVAATQPPKLPPPPVVPPPPPRPGFFERNPDLEKFIGENLVSKIGIAILVIAIAFFVKYAIDTGWIGPVGRVGIGLLCGGILVGIAHRLRASYAAFSSVLIGGGLAVFYFTIALAYKDYHLFSQPAAFIIMVVITAFAVTLSMLYNRQEVAVIALVGGFCVPFIVSDGSGNYGALFTYLLMLNTGLLVIAYRKSWRILNLLAFIFTVLLFGAWLTTLHAVPARTYRNGFIFATLFYLLFLAINIAHNVKQQQKFIASDFGIILANTSLYFGAGIYMIYAMKADHWIGLFSGAMGAFNLLLCFLLYRNKYIDKNVLYLLIGITLTFVSLTIPLQLHGNFITLFWATECVLLYWLFLRSRIPLTHLTAHIIWVLMLISLLMDMDSYIDSAVILTVVFNKGFITMIFAAGASYLLYYLHRKARLRGEVDPLSLPRQLFLIVAIVLLYLAGALELRVQLTARRPATDLNLLFILAYSYAFVLVLHLLSRRQKLDAVNQKVWLALLPLMIVVYLIFSPAQSDILEQVLLTSKPAYFIVHWIGALLAGTIIYRTVQELRSYKGLQEGVATIVTWVMAAVIVIFVSAELHLLMSEIFYDGPGTLRNIHHVFVRAGLPIIWGLCSFAFMWLGMKHRYRPLRIISLTLFSITLAKLFIFDIRNIPVAGKIAAFFCLGILLLVVSFMYQRLKKIIVEDERKDEL